MLVCLSVVKFLDLQGSAAYRVRTAGLLSVAPPAPYDVTRERKLTHEAMVCAEITMFIYVRNVSTAF